MSNVRENERREGRLQVLTDARELCLYTLHILKDGIRFLGFIFWTTPTGKVLMLMPGDKVRHERRKLRRMVNLAKLGEVTREKCDQCYESWRAHAKLGNTAKILMKMDRYYNGLWRDEHAKEDLG